MRKFIKKIVEIFTITGIYLVKFANKIYALSAEDIRVVPAYGVPETLESHNIFVNVIFLILLPITLIITIIIGTIKYIKKSRERKAVRNLIIAIIAIIAIAILIRVILLGLGI